MKQSNLLQLHTIIFLWGLTPVLGKLISLPSMDLVCYRLLIAGIALAMYMRVNGVWFRMRLSDMVEIGLMGIVVGIHWYTFYHAIKVSNVSMAMIGFSTITFFASIFQPILLRKPFYPFDVLYGILVFGGLSIIMYEERLHINGILWGMAAAITGAFFGIYNGRLITRHDAASITLMEFGGAFIMLFAARIILTGTFTLPIPDASDTIYLLILSVVCTTLAFTWSIAILKHFSPFTVIITNNLEPVYGIVISLLLFPDSEVMSATFYWGAALVLISVFTYPLVKRKWYGLE